MSKAERGLPAGFGLKLPPAPVELGDYLDEAPPPRAPAPLPAPPVVAVPAPAPAPVDAAEPPARRLTASPRRQFNMSPETIRMLDELVVHLRAHGPERDLRASEVVHALVLAAIDARPGLDLARVAPRGRWGSPSAAALPVALKEAFECAIVRKSS